MVRESLSSIALLAALAAMLPAQDLKPGAEAPTLAVAKWVKGDPVESFAEGHVYVIEFWATWCGPCIASIPHLTQVQHEYADRGVNVIGMTSKDPRNPLSKVDEFVASQGDAMDYRVAWDDGRTTNDAYMKASGQRGIPCSFLVDGAGKIAWIGHPYFLELPLEKVVAGEWDAENDPARIAGVIRELDMVRKLVATKKSEEAVKKLDTMIEEWPALEPIVGELRYAALIDLGDEESARSVGAGIVDRAIDHHDAMALNSIAWAIVDPEVSPPSRDLELALRAAVKAVEFSDEKDGAILDTLARVWFWKEDYKKALEWQEKAVQNSSDESIHETLEEYRRLVNGAQR